MAKTFTTEHTIQYYEADVKQHVTLPMLINISLEASTQQAASLHIGEEEVHSRGLGWIILESSLDIHEMPRVHDTVTVKTWVEEANSFFSIRHFQVIKDDVVMVEIKMLFALLDMVSRKLTRIPDDFIEVLEPKAVKRVKRLANNDMWAEGDDWDHVTEYAVRYNDIDTNLHVNNSHYYEWTTDALGVDFLANHRPVSMVVRFEHEIGVRDTVVSRYQKDELVTKHQICTGDTVGAQANIVWQKETDVPSFKM